MVCAILGTETKRFGKTKSDYYVLQPIHQPDSQYYIPVGNPAALSKLRPLMSRQELLNLLHSGEVQQDVWIQDENQRKNRFREILIQGNRGEILSMIYCLHLEPGAVNSFILKEMGLSSVKQD